jgi:TonB family protein
MNTLWLQNLAFYSAQILIVVAAGGSVRILLRLNEPRVVLRFWQVLLGICLALPLLQPWQPDLYHQSVNGQASVSLGAGRILSDSPVDWAAWLPDSRLVAGLVVAGILVRLGWMAAGLLRLRALRGRAVWLSASGLPLSDCPKSVPARFYITSELDRPATYGISDPVILLPVRALELEESQLRAILLHELEHIRGRHWPVAILEEIVRSIFWYHPAVSWLVRRIRLAREQVIDARIIRRTGGRRPYLQALLEMARAGAGVELLSASSFLSPHELAERATLIMKEPRMSRKRLLFAVSVLVPLLAASTLAAVWAFPLKGMSPFSAAGVPGQDSSPGKGEMKIIKQTIPDYPPEAKAKGIQGSVLLHVKVDRAGKVSGASALEGHELLRQAAVDAASVWEFEPLVRDGKAVPFETDITINFVLKGDRKEGGVPGGVPGGVKGGVPGGVKGGVPGGVKGGVPGGAGNKEHPQLLDRSVIPEYPPEAKEKKIQGKVTVEATIDEKGQVSEARLVSGPEIFKDSAISAIKAWKWAPAMKSGQPVPATATIDLNYELR